MLKFYLDTVLIYIFIFFATAIVFHKQFKELQKTMDELIGESEEKMGYLKTAIFYIVLSFIPVIRFITFWVKMWIIVDPEGSAKIVIENRNRKRGNK